MFATGASSHKCDRVRPVGWSRLEASSCFIVWPQWHLWHLVLQSHERAQTVHPQDQLHTIQTGPIFTDWNNGRIISVSLIVTGGKDSHQMLVMHHFETSSLFHALVTANDDIDHIHCTESLCDVPTKVYGRCSSWRAVNTKQVCAAIVIRDRIRPQDIVQPSIVCFQKDFGVQRPLHTSQLINGPLTISYTSMDRENLAINKAGKWKPLKSLRCMTNVLSEKTTCPAESVFRLSWMIAHKKSEMEPLWSPGHEQEWPTQFLDKLRKADA